MRERLRLLHLLGPTRSDEGHIVKHITVRMAWHDSGWDGTVCRDPAANSYCVGSHSLLSERLARNRSLKKETGKKGELLDVAMPDYLPPCYWTSCAFASRKAKI